jgi:carboxylesterase
MDEYLLLKSNYKKVHIAGLSMGGMLTLILGGTFHPDSLALMAPAISIRNKMAYTSVFMKYIVPSVKGCWNEEDESDPLRIAMGKEYWKRNNLWKVADMITLRRQALKNLAQVECPVLTIVSNADMTVAPDAIDIVKKGVSSKVLEELVLEKSPHVLINGSDREKVANRLIQWFQQEHL